jgi:hypothetical protein
VFGVGRGTVVGHRCSHFLVLGSLGFASIPLLLLCRWQGKKVMINQNLIGDRVWYAQTHVWPARASVFGLDTTWPRRSMARHSMHNTVQHRMSQLAWFSCPCSKHDGPIGFYPLLQNNFHVVKRNILFFLLLAPASAINIWNISFK